MSESATEHRRPRILTSSLTRLSRWCVLLALSLVTVEPAHAQDADHDGLGDAVETNAGFDVHSDSDGIPDHLDDDSDGDGVLDILEGRVDRDNDLLDAWRDDDDDGDGIPTRLETAPFDAFNGEAAHGLLFGVDVDLDGIPNHLDVDSDNDGALDADEGIGDLDNDGIPNYLDADDSNSGDDDGDGINSRAEFDEGLNPLNPDSDGDGLCDGTISISTLCVAGEDAASRQDSNNDGVLDALEPDDDRDDISTWVERDHAQVFGDDFDQDNVVNWLDDDSDDDGISDLIETDHDTDRGGSPDYLDLNSDDDDVPDSAEALGDSDGDGVPDHLDPDDSDGADGDGDGDGLKNTEESALGADAYQRDSDDDGVVDNVERGGAAIATDSDGDGVPDLIDDDDDGDGIATAIELHHGALFGEDPDGDNTVSWLDDDSDGDGHSDLFESAGDSDGDGVPDYLDLDSDNDGITDAAEGFDDSDRDGTLNIYDPDDFDGPNSDPDGDQLTSLTEWLIGTDPHLADSDHDGLRDDLEAPDASNPIDSDRDGLIDPLDFDDDNDQIQTPTEVEDEARLGGDIDGDGFPAHLDLDSDDDGIPDSIESERDFDEDGTPNYLDLDSDGDGALDADEGTEDCDADGAPDFIDEDNAAAGGDCVTDLDSDDDGIPNAIELATGFCTDPNNPDTDGDGLCDGTDDVAGVCVAGEDAESGQNTDAATFPDGDEIIDACDSDDDADTIPTATELEHAKEHGTDVDNDASPNWLDTNSDDDPFLDRDEAQDTDNNQVPDYLEAFVEVPFEPGPSDITSNMDAGSDTFSASDAMEDPLITKSTQDDSCDCDTIKRSTPRSSAWLWLLALVAFVGLARRPQPPSATSKDHDE